MVQQQFTHRGVAIGLSMDGAFEAEVGDEEIYAASLEEIKQKIAGTLDRARKYEVPCVLMMGSDDWPESAIGDATLRVGEGTYHGYNMHTREPRLRWHGDSRNIEFGYGGASRVYVLRIGVKSRGLVDELAAAINVLNNARRGFKAVVTKLEKADVTYGPHDKEVLVKAERAVAEGLGWKAKT